MATNNQIAAGGAVAAIIALASAYSIIPSEGLRQNAYRDPVGIPTICYGHTGDVKLGDRKTLDECKDILQGDALKHYEGVKACIKPEMTVGQAAGFTSFAFNVGVAKFCGSTIAKKANAGDMAGACAELSRWVYAGGQVLPGLVERRKKERALCEGKVNA